MPTYIYEAIDSRGNTQRGEMTVEDKEGVVDYLLRRELSPVLIEKKGEARRKRIASPVFGGVSIVDKIVLTKHLSAIIRAGLSLQEGLALLAADAKKPIMRAIFSEMKTNLEKGQPFYATFALYPKFFSPLFVGLVKAGEASGTLDETLDRLGDHLIREHEFRGKVLSAMFYPAILVAAAGGVILLLLTFVLPRLVKVFGEGAVELPAITRFIIAVSEVLTRNLFITFVVLFGGLLAFFYSQRTSFGKRARNALFSRIPVMGVLIRKIAITHFSQTLSVLLASGMPVLESLTLTAESMGDEAYSKAILHSRDEVSRGVPLSRSLEANRALFSELLLGMLVVGERTGTLEKILLMLAGFYEDETDRTLKTLVTLLEPTLLVIMGFIVGAIALSVLLPIYQMVGQIG